jgi:hypothetical protein
VTVGGVPPTANAGTDAVAATVVAVTDPALTVENEMGEEYADQFPTASRART